MRRGHSGKSNRAVDPSSLSGFGHGTADIAESKKGSEPAAVAGVCDAEVRRDDLSTIFASRLGKVCKCQVGVHCAPATLGRYRRCAGSLLDSKGIWQKRSTPSRISASILQARQVPSPLLAEACDIAAGGSIRGRVGNGSLVDAVCARWRTMIIEPWNGM